MSFFDTMLEDVETMAIIGHIRPDGDCIGSCLAAYNYLEEHYPDVRVTVFLEEPSIKFGYLKNIGLIMRYNKTVWHSKQKKKFPISSGTRE